MADNLPDPASREESYLAKAAGMDVTIPEKPESRVEQYLEAIAEGGGGGGGSYSAGTGIDIANNTISVDTDTIQEKLTAGTGIDITNNTISATGGGGPTVVQTTGTSTTDVMSQNATTSMVFKSGSDNNMIQIGNGADTGNYSSGHKRIAIGAGATATGNKYNISIGASITCTPTISQHSGIAINGSVSHSGTINIGGIDYAGDGDDNVIIGRSATPDGSSRAHCVALGAGAKCTRSGEVNVGTIGIGENYGYNSTNYRVIGGVHDPVDAHDAATKGYVDGLVGNIESALNVINNGGSN